MNVISDKKKKHLEKKSGKVRNKTKKREQHLEKDEERSSRASLASYKVKLPEKWDKLAEEAETEL